MRRVITGFNATNAAQGQRLGFTYTEKPPVTTTKAA